MRKLQCFGTVAICHPAPDSLPVSVHGQYRFIVWARSRKAAVEALNRCGVRYSYHESAQFMGTTGNPQELATEAVDGAVYAACANYPRNYVQYKRKIGVDRKQQAGLSLVHEDAAG